MLRLRSRDLAEKKKTFSGETQTFAAQKDHDVEKRKWHPFAQIKPCFEAGKELALHVAYLRKPVPFLFIILSSCPSVIVSVNFAAFVVDGGKIIMDMAHNSNRVNSGFFVFFSSLLWHEKQATSWGEPEAYCGAGHCWLDERRIQVTFLIELFCVCFSTWHSLSSLARDNQWG